MKVVKQENAFVMNKMEQMEKILPDLFNKEKKAGGTQINLEFNFLPYVFFSPTNTRNRATR